MIEEKLQNAIEKIKSLKSEKEELERRVSNLEEIIKTKNQEIENLIAERELVRRKVEELLKELDLVADE